jgi:hypothetical protein
MFLSNLARIQYPSTKLARYSPETFFLLL